MDDIVLAVIAAVGLLVVICSGYLWYLTAGVEESKPVSTIQPR